MNIATLLKKEVVVLRLQDIGGDKMALSTVTATMNCEIQPLADVKSSLGNGVFGKTFVAYTDGDVSLFPGDTLRDTNGNRYTIKTGGVSPRTFGNLTFVKVIMELTG